MNFNFSGAPEYDLNSSLSKEMINLYGVNIKFILAERVNTDRTVFGDFSHLKTDGKTVFDFFCLPENTEGWDDGGYHLTAFGPINFENIALFVHRDSLSMLEIQKITGNLLLFPNHKLMEITDVDAVVPGVNNLFTFQDSKTILKLSCKPYDHKVISEVKDTFFNVSDSLDDSIAVSEEYSDGDFESLEKYFDELTQRENGLLDEMQELKIPSVVPSGSGETPESDVSPDKREKRPTIDAPDDVWGKFG